MWTAGAAAIAIGGCAADDGGGGDRPCDSSGDCPDGEVCVDTMCVPAPDGGLAAGGDDGSPPDDAGPECIDDDECTSGLCLDGTCCDSEDNVCGESCCTAGEVCFANACVVPGDSCTSDTDCDADQFCERSLGEGGSMDGGVADGGMPGDGGAGDGVCLGEAPTPGRCLDLPPRCDGSGGTEPCIRECEFRPDFEDLNVAEQWHWEATDEYPDHVDVWSTPVVGRVYDTNCDGAVDALDPPNIVVVSGFSKPTQCAAKTPSACRRGVLRVLDGATGTEIWALRSVDGSVGFAGHTAALGDVNGDDRMEIVVLTGEGRVAVVDGDGTVLGVSTEQVDGRDAGAFGWGGGPALGDMQGDGTIEVAFRRSVFSIEDGTPVHQWTGTGGARAGSQALSFFVDLDGDGERELLAGRSAYEPDGTLIYDNTSVGNGFPAVGDFDGDGAPEVVMVAQGQTYILEGSDGSIELGPVALGASGHGGPPTVADFDGDGDPEIGVAQQNNYYMLEANYAGGSIDIAWTAPNHDFSSSVTGSTVFDFEGDGVAEVIYNDECFLWVYDGPTGEVRFSTPTTSFTATEASLVADVDGDGHAEIVMGSNGANPDSWHCNHHAAGGGGAGFPEWTPPEGAPSYRGITVFRDAENSWVGTRQLWNQHAYHVTNVCSDRDSACDPARPTGAIPQTKQSNWTLPWLNNFRQNVQEEGIFDAPDAVVSLSVACTNPPELTAAVRNLGEAILPSGVEVGFFARAGGSDTMLGTATTSTPLFPGQVTELTLTAPDGTDPMTPFVARILIDPDARTFRECDESNNESEEAVARCID